MLRNKVWLFSTCGFCQEQLESQKKTDVSFDPFKSFSKANTLLNSPPLSVSKAGMWQKQRSTLNRFILTVGIVLSAVRSQPLHLSRRLSKITKSIGMMGTQRGSQRMTMNCKRFLQKENKRPSGCFVKAITKMIMRRNSSKR